MNKAIFYKERIKIRRFYPLATAVLAGFTAYALLRIGRMYAFNGAASVWLAVLDRGDVLVDPLKYLPALVGAGLGLAQFLPEITQKRLKLTLHLPDSRRAMMLGMLGYGLVLLTMLFAVQLLAIGLYLRHLMAPELVHAVVSTTLPWYAAGFAGYLFAAWICIEPTWRQRLFDALIAAGVMRLLFSSDALRVCDPLLPWIAAVVLCALFFRSTRRSASGGDVRTKTRTEA